MGTVPSDIDQSVSRARWVPSLLPAGEHPPMPWDHALVKMPADQCWLPLQKPSSLDLHFLLKHAFPL